MSEQDILQKKLELDKLKARESNYVNEYSSTKRQSDISRDLYKMGALSEANYLEDKIRLQSIQSRLSEVRNEIPIIKSEIAQITLKKQQIQEVGFS